VKKKGLLDIQIPFRSCKRFYSEQTIYQLSAVITQIDGTNILACDFKLVCDLKKIRYYARIGEDFTVFSDGESYITYLHQSKKWSKACIETLLPYYWQEAGKIYCPKKDSETVKSFFNTKAEGPFALHDFQKEILGNNLDVKNRRVRERLARVMKQAAPLTEGFKNWTKKGAFYHYQYIFYRRVNKKTAKGYCTNCKRELVFETKGVGHNKEGKCPKCHHPITYKAVGKSTRVGDHIAYCSIQKVNEGILARYFEDTKRLYPDYRKPTYSRQEYYRLLIMDNGRIISYKQRFTNYDYTFSGWQQWNSLDEIHKSYLYSKNLKSALFGTPYQYSALDVLAQKRIPVFIDRFFERSFGNPGIEHLIKNGFENLVNELFVNYYRADRVLKLKGTTIKQVLGVQSKNEVNFLRSLHVDSGTLDFYKKLINAGIRIKDDIFHQLMTYRCVNIPERIIEIGKHTTMEKLVTYAKKQQAQKNSLFFSDYADYLKTCELLDIPLDNKSALFPKDLKSAHDKVTLMYRTKEDEILNGQIKARAEKINQLYGYRTKTLLIKAPDSHKEFIGESAALHHCVASMYAKRHARGETDILFIRKTNRPDKPYCTLEIYNGKVVQCRGINNGKPPEEVDKFVKEWLKKIIDKPKREEKTA
jgi:hypothetical protein